MVYFSVLRKYSTCVNILIWLIGLFPHTNVPGGSDWPVDLRWVGGSQFGSLWSPLWRIGQTPRWRVGCARRNRSGDGGGRRESELDLIGRERAAKDREKPPALRGPQMIFRNLATKNLWMTLTYVLYFNKKRLADHLLAWYFLFSVIP